MTLPITPLFWIDTASLRSGSYRDTISHYHDLLRTKGGSFTFSSTPEVTWVNLPRPHAYVRITDAEKPGLSEHIDWLYQHDVMPVVEDGSQLRERGRADLLHLLDRPNLQAEPFTFYVPVNVKVGPAVEGSKTSSPMSLFQMLNTAVRTLATNHQIVSVGFPSLFAMQPQPVSDLYAAAVQMGAPAVVRTRDLYLAAHLAHGQPHQPEQVLNAFSAHPARHLSFLPSIARTIL